MLAGIPEAARVLENGMLEATGFIQEDKRGTSRLGSSDPDPKIPPQNPSAGLHPTGVLNSSHFPASPGALPGSGGWGWNSPSRVSALRAELGILPEGIIP